MSSPKFALALPPRVNDMWRLAGQMGVTHAVAVVPRPLPVSDFPLWDRAKCAEIKKLYDSHDLEMAVVEGRLVGIDSLRLGTRERDDELEKIYATLKNFREFGISVWCYNWMTYFGARRTSKTIPERGGALATGFDRRADKPYDSGATPPISEKQLWENFRFFLAKVLPAAEKAKVKLALHPDDPPLPEVAGVPRLFHSVESFQRAMDLYESESNGICFCQANFAAMGADIPETIRAFGKAGRLNFVHFRDIRGTADQFVETFHDNGQTDMLTAMRAYAEVGFSGVMRPDHAPSMWGEVNDIPGYEKLGKIFAIGYMTGLREAVNATRDPRKRAPAMSAGSA